MNKEIQEQTSEPGKIWKTSITKTELATLPAESFRGKITLVDNIEDAAGAVEELAKARCIGFDTETKPSFRRGEHNTVALLQLATPDHSFLFRLNHIGLPKCVSDLLENPDILKIGVSIHDDFLNLHKKYKLEPKGFIDLQSYVKEYNIADNSLSRIYGILFDKRISKSQRLTNWEAPTLTRHQQEYASLDAVACLHIYYYLKQHGFDYRTSKYYREFDDPNYQPPVAEGDESK